RPRGATERGAHRRRAARPGRGHRRRRQRRGSAGAAGLPARGPAPLIDGSPLGRRASHRMLAAAMRTSNLLGILAVTFTLACATASPKPGEPAAAPAAGPPALPALALPAADQARPTLSLVVSSAP